LDKRIKKVTIRFGLPLLLTLIILTVFLRKVSWLDLKNTFLSIPISCFLLFITLVLIGVWLRAYRYYLLLGKRITMKDLFLITLVRNFAVDLLPARSAALIFYTFLTHKQGVEYEEGASSFVVAIFYDLLALAVMLAGLGLFLKGGISRGVMVWALVILFTLSVAFIGFSHHILAMIVKLGFIRKMGRLERILIKVQDYLRAHQSYSERLKLFVLSLLIRLGKYISLYLLFWAVVRIPISSHTFSQFCFGMAGTEMSSMLPIQGLGGFGTWELAFAIFFKTFNIPAGDPFLTGLVIHVTTQVWEYSVGLAAFLYLSVRRKKGH
jgi:uncharacterized membrane protein YbhN (UPF0104 family)